ncbi:hypothetical protein CIHG_03840 [Coccidioides immitis H538.4]|uniref:Uncharacterized protein n=3 Tax=Coccidioides immitis TaxID=5501 RepID=A0A0J8QQL9_COCIT|nr:hypothetical protein CIRG_03593 [Coccidioides immitis RMSCC 2394]KMU74879.1 hypothetical protein CISG_00809 [Coccidioides immitis RMSCC 3703]KMU86054.1 hypothetical protein CIHG_03840 [Coccidioides immitis H538.4]
MRRIHSSPSTDVGRLVSASRERWSLEKAKLVLTGKWGGRLLASALGESTCLAGYLDFDGSSMKFACRFPDGARPLSRIMERSTGAFVIHGPEERHPINRSVDRCASTSIAFPAWPCSYMLSWSLISPSSSGTCGSERWICDGCLEGHIERDDDLWHAPPTFEAELASTQAIKDGSHSRRHIF